MVETGWTKEDPKTDGVYWWRADEHDSNPDILEVQGEFFYQAGFGSSEVIANFGGEWLGPVLSSDFEELVRLRTLAKDVSESEIKGNYILDSRTEI